MRLEAESAVVREAFPAEWADLVVVVTTLGDVEFLMVALAICYWLVRRRDTALVIAFAFAGFAFLLTVRTLIAAPRPPEELYLVPYEADGYGFPSGHAFAAAVIYGGLYATFRPTRKRIAMVAVAATVVLVSLSRVVLGVHYLGDVLVGAALGALFLLAMVRLCDGDPRRGFAVALGLSIPALLVVGLEGDSLLAIGGSAGGLLGTARLESLPRLRSRLEGVVLAVAGVAFVGWVLVLESAVETLSLAVAAPALFALYGLLVSGILLAPAAVGRLEVSALTGSVEP